MPRVLIADDHGIVRRGIRTLLESEPGVEIVGEASDGREALRLCQTLRPDIAILDIAMPQLNGIEVTAQASKHDPKLKVIILSMYADETYIIRALIAGARSYLMKEATEDDLLPALRAVVAGKSFFSPGISKILLDDYVRQLQNRGLTDSWELLSNREREVLQLLAEGHTNKEVASLLNVGVSTIDTHRNRIMQKLNLRHFADLVLYAVRKGIISSGNAGPLSEA
jgi:two-component system, NarL family, response regulator NreC